jgi:hypothetical protein
LQTWARTSATNSAWCRCDTTASFGSIDITATGSSSILIGWPVAGQVDSTTVERPRITVKKRVSVAHQV